MDSASRIAELVERLGRLVRAQDYAHGLNPAQWETLRYLARCNRFSNTASALALYLGTTKGTVSQTLNALERKGLIRRTADPASRRIVRLSLTVTGQARLRDDPLGDLRRAAARLADEDRDSVAAGLSAILVELLRAREGRPFGPCATCRHFQRNVGGAGAHRCRLVGEPLSEADSQALCVDHSRAA